MEPLTLRKEGGLVEHTSLVPGNSGVAIKVDIQLKLANEVEGLEVVIPRLVIRAGVGDFFRIAYRKIE